jgi:transposase-like protein
MSNQRYTPEFKDEAVRQVIDGRHSVQEVGLEDPLNPKL